MDKLLTESRNTAWRKPPEPRAEGEIIERSEVNEECFRQRARDCELVKEKKYVGGVSASVCVCVSLCVSLPMCEHVPPCTGLRIFKKTWQEDSLRGGREL